jgi:trehalose 6-phosphate synthase
VVSNREPYLHNYDGDGRIVCTPATGGVAVALDALMRERGGIWIAHGAGTADRAVVDAASTVGVPPPT